MPPRPARLKPDSRPFLLKSGSVNVSHLVTGSRGFLQQKRDSRDISWDRVVDDGEYHVSFGSRWWRFPGDDIPVRHVVPAFRHLRFPGSILIEPLNVNVEDGASVGGIVEAINQQMKVALRFDTEGEQEFLFNGYERIEIDRDAVLPIDEVQRLLRRRLACGNLTLVSDSPVEKGRLPDAIFPSHPCTVKEVVDIFNTAMGDADRLEICDRGSDMVLLISDTGQNRLVRRTGIGKKQIIKIKKHFRLPVRVNFS
jgi:hypothetical protein